MRHLKQGKKKDTFQDTFQDILLKSIFIAIIHMLNLYLVKVK